MAFLCLNCAAQHNANYTEPEGRMDICVGCNAMPAAEDLTAAVLNRIGQLESRREVPGAITHPCPTEHADEPFLDPAEVIRIYKFASLRALYAAVRRGLVPAHKLGRRLKFLRSELDRAVLDSSA